MGCHREKSNLSQIENFYKNARSQNLDLFLNVLLIPRQYDKATKKYGLDKVIVEFYNNDTREQIILPAIGADVLPSKLEQTRYYENILKYSKRKKISIDSTIKYISRIVKLYEELRVIQIESHPDLGEFIIFKINESNEVIYLKNSETVYNNFWKTFFRTGKKLIIIGFLERLHQSKLKGAHA